VIEVRIFYLRNNIVKLLAKFLLEFRHLIDSFEVIFSKTDLVVICILFIGKN
jgi:hypothetical protein